VLKISIELFGNKSDVLERVIFVPKKGKKLQKRQIEVRNEVKKVMCITIGTFDDVYINCLPGQ